MILNVLVPTDGSDHAGKAVTLAADIAEKYGARLVFLLAPVSCVRRHGHAKEAPRARVPAGYGLPGTGRLRMNACAAEGIGGLE